MGFAAEISDPLRPLRESPVSEEIIRPPSELLVTDLLVGTGRAKSIREFRLGVPIRGRRSLTLAWKRRTARERGNGFFVYPREKVHSKLKLGVSSSQLQRPGVLKLGQSATVNI